MDDVTAGFILQRFEIPSSKGHEETESTRKRISKPTKAVPGPSNIKLIALPPDGHPWQGCHQLCHPVCHLLRTGEHVQHLQLVMSQIIFTSSFLSGRRVIRKINAKAFLGWFGSLWKKVPLLPYRQSSCYPKNCLRPVWKRPIMHSRKS